MKLGCTREREEGARATFGGLGRNDCGPKKGKGKRKFLFLFRKHFS
jgi:hypothetical protein